MDISKYFRPRTNIYVVTKGRDSGCFSTPTDADRDVMGEVAIIADNHPFVGHNASVMTDEKSTSNFGFVGDGNPKFDLESVIDQPGERKYYPPD